MAVKMNVVLIFWPSNMILFWTFIVGQLWLVCDITFQRIPTALYDNNTSVVYWDCKFYLFLLILFEFLYRFKHIRKFLIILFTTNTPVKSRSIRKYTTTITDKHAVNEVNRWLVFVQDGSLDNISIIYVQIVAPYARPSERRRCEQQEPLSACPKRAASEASIEGSRQQTVFAHTSNFQYSTCMSVNYKGRFSSARSY